MATTEMSGSWKLVESENFDAYMKAIGVNFAMRAIGNSVKSTVSIEARPGDDNFKLVTSSTFRTHKHECAVGKVSDEETLDGRKAKTLVNWKDGVLVQEQTWNGKTTTISRHVDDEGRMITNLRMGDITSKRVYERIQEQKSHSSLLFP